MKHRPYLNARRREMLKWRWFLLPPVAGIVSFLTVWLIFYLHHRFDPLAPWTKESWQARVWWAACCGATVLFFSALSCLIEFQFGPPPRGGYDPFGLRRFPRVGRWCRTLPWAAAAGFLIYKAVTPYSTVDHPPCVTRCLVGFALASVAIVMMVIQFRRRPQL